MRVCASAVAILAVAVPCVGLAAPPVDERADDLLRAMGRTLAAAKRMSFQVAAIESLVDEETGKVVHLTSARSIALARPDRLRVEETSSFTRHAAWFSAGRLTVLDAAVNQYAVADVPATIDAMLDHLFEQYELVMPIADLLFSDPYATLSAGVGTGEHLGDATVGGRRCHHLAFTQEHLDWQVWIETKGEQALPVKIVITYKNEPGDPQFTARLSGWDLAPALPAGHFDPVLPRDAERVSLEELTGAPATGG